MALTKKRRVFIEEYLKCWNATEAARRAGYAERYLHTNAPKLLQNTTIAEAIQERLEQVCMGADEVLTRLAEHARADISDFLTGYGAIDWEKVRKNGRLVKRIAHSKGRNSTIELHDAQAALALLGKHHRLFVDRIEAQIEHSFDLDEWKRKAEATRQAIDEMEPE